MNVYCIAGVNGHLCKSIKDGSLAVFEEYRNAYIEMQRIGGVSDNPIQISKCVLMSKKGHDRLTSENERLREMVKAAYIEGSKSGYSDGLSDGQSWSSNNSSSNPDGDWEYSDAKQLLTELEKGDEQY